MEYKNIQCSTLLNKITKKDKLFKGNYTLDPYQNCEFGCTYCDSTYEKTIYIKTNAIPILEKEIKNIQKGTIIIGSVSDAYQKIEEKHKITRNLLEILKQKKYQCHIITKSNLVLRDLDILSKMDCRVTITIITLDKKISQIFEEGAPSSNERLKTIKKLSKAGIKTGIAMIPILPHIVENELEEIIKSASKYKAEYVLHKHLELKGDQKHIFMELIKNFYPNLFEEYEKLYSNNYKPCNIYVSKIKEFIDELCLRYNLKNKI